MSKRKVSVRLPSGVVRAYDAADGNRSKVMRAVLAEAVTEGEVEGVPDDLRTLAAVESEVQGGALPRRRGTFRKRMSEFFKEKWDSGYVTTDDAREMSESWLNEATIYGPEYVAWAEAIIDWYTDHWDPVARPDWPEPSTFHSKADPGSVDVSDRLVGVMENAKADDLPRARAVRRLSKYHPDGEVEAAAERAYGGGE